MVDTLAWDAAKHVIDVKNEERKQDKTVNGTEIPPDKY